MVKWTEADRNVLLGNPNPSTGKMQQTLAKLADFAAQNLPGTGEAITGLVQRSTVYNVGQQVKSPNCPVNFVLECTDAGQTASSQIAWPEPVEGVVVLDGTVSWTFKKLGASVWDATVPAWWLERGDGSLGDKVCTNGEIFEGVYNFNNFTVPAGVTIYVNKTATILCTGSFKNDGSINGTGRGAAGTTESGRDRAVSLGYFGGGTGWWGSTTETSNGEFSGSAPSWVIAVFEKQQHLRFYGSAGSAQYSRTGGNGGAGLSIISKYCLGSGSYIMDGGAPGGSGGGGATYGGGGIVFVVAETIQGTKTASVGGAAVGWFKFIELGVM